MPRALVGLLVVLGVFVAVVSTAALVTGVNEARLASSGPRRDFAAAELPPDARGLVAVFGCVRHDLAVGVTADGAVYPLGAPPSGAGDDDRVFTPLTARADCDEGRAPRRVFAVVEDDDALGNTIGRVYQARVAPPPVPAFVDGVIGFGAGHARACAKARAFWAGRGLDVAAAPLLQKGKRPGVRWVAITTAAAGAHGYLLILLGAIWAVRKERRARRRAADRAQFSDDENDFLDQA